MPLNNLKEFIAQIINFNTFSNFYTNKQISFTFKPFYKIEFLNDSF